MKSIILSIRLGSVLMVALTQAANADIAIEERTSVEGAGIMRMANMSGTSVTTISGSRARIESDMQLQSRMVRVFARGMGPKADIIRLDQDKAYHLDIKKKQYTEQSFAEQRAQMQAAMEQASKAQPPIGGIDESQCEWSDPKSEVKKTGERASFAGMDAERVSITATQSCRDKRSGAVCEFGLAFDQWIAPSFAGGGEAQKFYSSYAQKLGFDGKEGMRRAESMFGRYKGLWTEVAAKMRDVQGYPVKSTFGLVIGGPQCQSTAQTTQSSESSGQATPGGIAGRIAGSILNRRKQAQDGEPAAGTPLQVNGLTPILIVNTELASVKADATPPGAFDVPADFKKVSQAD